MLRAISLYTGVGGLDFGMHAAGFRTVAAVEMDRSACASIAKNGTHWRRLRPLAGDIHEISSRAILESAGVRKGEVDLLIAGPPCQPFSKSGYWASGDALRLDDPRATTLEAFLRVLRDIKPRTFLLENVHGLAYSEKSEGLAFLLRGVAQVNREARTNYGVSWSVLNAADFGVPQTRERVFLVASRDGKPFSFPTPTHVPANLLESSSDQCGESHRTAWDAIGDLADHPVVEEGLEINGRWGDLLPSIPEGSNYLWHTNRGGGMPLFGWRRRYWTFLLKLAKRRPSWTIQAQPGPYVGPFHWNNRRLTTAELCRLQTFPDGLHFECSRNELQRMLGNAVPSLLAEVLGREIRQQLLGSAKRTRLKLLPPRREGIPAPEPTRAVPEKFWHLVGTHADHPGTGKGRRALELADARQRNATD
jgi:DNA (cytosine-5)-methyltransferase 1